MIFRTLFSSAALIAAVAMSVTRAVAITPAEPTEFDRPVRPFTYEFTAGDLGWKTSGPFTGITKNFRKNPIPLSHRAGGGERFASGIDARRVVAEL